jgi:hypothetical protein
LEKGKKGGKMNIVNPPMRKRQLWLMLAILVAVALLSGFWAITSPPFIHAPSPFRERPPMHVSGDIELYYTAKTVVSTVNLVLLIFLLATYVGIYGKTRSEFTIGLIIFSLVLLLHAITSNPLTQWLFGFQGSGLGPFAIMPDLFTFAALVVLLYLTVKY